MAFCLPKLYTEKFVTALKDGTINPEKLTDMSSEERRKFFEGIVGEDAKEVNAQLESKLLLKDQQRGLISWAKKLTGITEEARNDMISKISRLTKVLDPENQKSFLEDYASKKLGIDITFEESKKIAELSKRIEETKANMEAGGDRMDYGLAKVDLMNYVNDLKKVSEKFTLKDAVTRPVEAISKVAGQLKAIKASMDDSAIFRQGWRSMITNPKIWADNAVKSFANIYKQFKGTEVMDEINADITSRPNYDRMVKAKLNVGTIEESFPTAFPEKIPLFGRLYKASEVGFTAFVHKLRADIFDKYIEIAEDSGVDINDKDQLLSIGKLVNSLTGRGDLGRIEPVAGIVNNVFFSPRYLKSQFDTLTAHSFQKGVTPFVRKQAAINLVKIVVAQATIMTLANIIQPGSAETDPRSSDFGKIKAGSTRFDVSGGAASLVTLASRLITMSTKSSTTGKISPINSGKFGSQTGTDVVYNFFENKLSPASSVIKDLLKGQTFSGEKPTFLKEAQNVLVPFPIQNLIQKSDPKSANKIIMLIADGLGLNANTYTSTKKTNSHL